MDLIELDSVEITVIIDNELDPISACSNPAILQGGNLKDVALRGPKLDDDDVRGVDAYEIRMDHICCSAHGLSLLITGVKGDQRRSILFDTGPEGQAWEHNVRRLKVDIGQVEVIQLSHWHRDHSGGMLRAIEMVNQARIARDSNSAPVIIDLHPDRPEFRGVQPPGSPIFSLEADPSFAEISKVGSMLDGMFMISGEIPRITSYEMGLKYGKKFNPSSGQWEVDDKIVDERFLMCNMKGKGIVMFTGCSHAGVVNASTHAAGLGGGIPFYAVMGGYHLADGLPETISTTVTDLRALGIQNFITGHCTGWRAKFDIQRQMPGKLVPSFVGSTFTL